MTDAEINQIIAEHCVERTEMSHSKEPFGVDCWVGNMIHDFTGLRIAETAMDDTGIANAAHIVACVNFCAGISEDILIGTPLAQWDFGKDIMRLRKELDEAKAETEKAIVAVSIKQHGASGMCCQLRLMEKARAEKAEAKLSEAQARIKELEAFQKWVNPTGTMYHKPYCFYTTSNGGEQCTCGLSALLSK